MLGLVPWCLLQVLCNCLGVAILMDCLLGVGGPEPMQSIESLPHPPCPLQTYHQIIPHSNNSQFYSQFNRYMLNLSTVQCWIIMLCYAVCTNIKQNVPYCYLSTMLLWQLNICISSSLSISIRWPCYWRVREMWAHMGYSPWESVNKCWISHWNEC